MKVIFSEQLDSEFDDIKLAFKNLLNVLQLLHKDHEYFSLSDFTSTPYFVYDVDTTFEDQIVYYTHWGFLVANL